MIIKKFHNSQSQCVRSKYCYKRKFVEKLEENSLQRQSKIKQNVQPKLLFLIFLFKLKLEELNLKFPSFSSTTLEAIGQVMFLTLS